MDASSDGPSSPPHRYPDWVMLDRRIRVDGYPEEDHFHATTACAMSSDCETIRVSICAAPPPAASRLFVSWTGTRHLSSEYLEDYEDPRPSFLFMAAHGSSILLRLRHNHHRSDLFVYTARSTGLPLLRPLPGLDRRSDAYIYEADWLYGMFGRDRDSVGLLCDGDGGEFVVAELQIHRRYRCEGTPVKVGLCVYRSGSPDNNWKARWLRIRYRKGHAKELNLLGRWSTHEVISFRDSLCYVDYSLGILFADVLRDCPELHYVRLPVKIPVRELEIDNGHTNFSERSRSLCVTNGGRTMKFVEVVTTAGFVSFTIKVWRLRQEGKSKSMTWETESNMKDVDLWAQPGYGDLPRVTPTFPRVSLEEPNLIYLMLSKKSEVDHEDETWVIVVDMLNKTLRSSYRGTNDSGSLATTNRAFIPCAFSKYLHVPESS